MNRGRRGQTTSQVDQDNEDRTGHDMTGGTPRKSAKNSTIPGSTGTVPVPVSAP